MPATREQLDNIFNLLKQYSTKQRQHLVDLGSGDGRIVNFQQIKDFIQILFLQVFEAAQHGFPRATGIELNRVLVTYARLKSLFSGQQKICKFKRANLWKVNTSFFS